MVHLVSARMNRVPRFVCFVHDKVTKIVAVWNPDAITTIEKTIRFRNELTFRCSTYFYRHGTFIDRRVLRFTNTIVKIARDVKTTNGIYMSFTTKCIGHGIRLTRVVANLAIVVVK
ncbi:hypothetical protein Hanom_Chr09g00798551 [Helianthus anomalus]